jgi:iron complex outermembrane receptor protein
VTELGAKQIAETGVGGSVATLLRQAPSVYVYQQGIGNNEPVLSIRGLRGLEVAQTLDGVPMQDLLNGGSGAYLQNNVGGRFNLDQISGVSIYPGVAYPDKNTFGTIGGTIAYDSKRPTNDYYVDVFGSVGSFQTFNEGFTINSGRLDGPLGTGDNAPKLLLQYSNLQTAGFIDYTPARYNNMEFAFDKPYDDGLSKFQATVLYNTGNGLIQSEPTPLPYLNQNGLFSNYPPNLLFQRETNDYLSIILKNDTYINDYVQVGATAFYLNSDSALQGFGNINLFTPPGFPNPNIVGNAAPFVQNPAGFGENGLYGPGGPFYNGVQYRYNPQAAYPIGSKYCPTSIANAWAAFGSPNPCGINSQIVFTHDDTYGIQPRIQIIPPEYYGIDNTIKIGGLFAKETSPSSPNYLGGGPVIPTTPGNLVSGTGINGGYDGGSYRAIYEGYIQDKIDLLENTLHITPGVTLEGTATGANTSVAFVSADPAYPGVTGYRPFKATRWDRDWLPFVNVSYDLDKVLPPVKGTSLYASYGSSALFAPTSDFTPNTTGSAPSASIVHMYEAGAKYNSSRLLLQVDYFYQKVDRDFGFFQGQAGPIAGQDFYTNSGQREFKGVEMAATWQVTPDIQLFANGSHTLAKYLKTYLASVTVFEDQFGLAQKGTPITGVPDWLSNFGVQYDHKDTFRDGDTMAIRFAGQYTGHQYTSTDLTGLETNIPSPAGIPTNAINPATGAPYPPGYIPYLYKAGATTFDPHGGISPFVIFNLDASYTLPTPELPMLKHLKFDLNIMNLFNQHYFQYFYRQISPSTCGNFTSGPFKGLPQSNYSCGSLFADGLPGEPFAVIFTMTARF